MPGLLARLHEGAATALKSAYAPKSSGPVNSALAALARFAVACPERELFRRPRFRGDLEASAHNEWTLILLVWFLVTEPSPTTGKPLKADTARTYASLLKGYLSHSYAFDLVDGKAERLSSLISKIAEGEPLGGVRKKRRAFRRRHLRRLGRLTGADLLDPDAVNYRAGLGTNWHVLARGGETFPGVPPAGWRPDVHPTRADLEFHVHKSSRGVQRYAVLWLRPLKKKGKPHAPKVPQYICEHDGGGSDVYWMLRDLEQYDPVPAAERAHTPLFRRRVRGTNGYTTRHINVGEYRTYVKACAAALGYTDMSEWGAHSTRVGGATDLASTGKATELVLRAKGRWSSEIGAIYARMTAASLLAASRLMQKARGRDLEELIPAFVQPA